MTQETHGRSLIQGSEKREKDWHVDLPHVVLKPTIPCKKNFLGKEKKKSVFTEGRNFKFYKTSKVLYKMKKAFVSRDKIWLKTKHLELKFLENIQKNPLRASVRGSL